MEQAAIAGYSIVLPPHRAEFHRTHPQWHKAWLDSIHQTLKPDDVVIDVGCEQGDLSALIASWIPDGQMHLIEPVAGFWPTIRETFDMNGLPPPHTAFVGFAADQTPETVRYSINKWPTAAYDGLRHDPGFQHLNERPDLPRMDLDYYRLDEPTAVLIDVEGAELRVLSGAVRLLIEKKPTVWCAIHPEIMAQRYDDDPNQLLDYMGDMGYRWELLGFQGEIHVVFRPE